MQIAVGGLDLLCVLTPTVMMASSAVINVILVCCFAVLAMCVEIAPPDGRQREYCQWETFNARCPSDNQVIVISDAVYGRIEYGRCIRPEYGYIGCKANVRRLAAAQCSGRHQCQIHVPDKLLDRTRPCREDLKLYLLISYTCVKVLMPIGGACRSPVANRDSGMLSSVASANTGCGSPTTPWMIDVGPGQRINVSLIDFSPPPATEHLNTSVTTSRIHCQSTARRVCYNQVYAVIKERVHGGHGVTICGRQSPADAATYVDEETVYLSDSNSIEVRIIAARSTKDGRQFLLRYKAVGCADVTPPRNVWWKRNGDGANATFGCTGKLLPVYQMTCIGNDWHSDTTPDSIDCPDSPQTGSLLSVMIPVSHSFTVILILCIALAVGLLIFIAGMCVIHNRRKTAAANKRRTAQQQQRAQYIKDGSQSTAYMSMKYDNRSLYPYAVSLSTGARTLPCGPQYDGGVAGDGDTCSWRSNVDNEYAYVDELLAPPPAAATGHQSPSRQYTSTSNNNNAYCPRTRQSAPDHVTGCLLACRQYDMAPPDMPQVDDGNN